MKLYLVDDYKVFVYSLPNKVEDAFIINYVHSTGKEETITFMAEDGKWSISSSFDIQYSKNNQTIEKDFIENGSIYSIQFSDLTDVVSLYCFDIPQSFYEFEIPINKKELYLGRNGTFDILYESDAIQSPHMHVFKQNNNWYIEDNGTEQSKIYVNNKRIKKTILKFGDVIFVAGLKIIWLNSFIKLTNPNSKVKTTLPQYNSNQSTKENTFTPVKETEKAIVLYNDNQVFFHTPRMKEFIEEKEIVIENPPPMREQDEMPAILSVGTTAVMGASSLFTGIMAVTKVTSGQSTWADASTELVLCGTMVIGALILPIIIDRYSKNIEKKKEENRKKVYREYLVNLRERIKQEIETEQRILLENYFDAEQLKSIIKNKSNKIWSREIPDDDFLNIRLGIGNKNAAIKIVFNELAYDIDKDELYKDAKSLSEEKTILQNVPITISLIKNSILPIVISNDFTKRKQFLNFLLLQLISYYSGNDLKIAIFTTEDNRDQWDFLKYLPHTANDTRKVRFYSENEDEARQVSSTLEKIYQSRFDKVNRSNSDSSSSSDTNETIDYSNDSELYKNFDTYYLIITDNYITAKRHGIIKKILDNTQNLGFSLMTVESTMQNVPSRCDNIVVVNNGAAGIVNKSLNDNEEQNSFVTDTFEESIKPYANIISNIPLSAEVTAGTLPKVLTFLEMYKVGKIEQLNILNRWNKNDPTISIATPIGVREDGKLFELDLHEKYHGPHGLIAGSTGSGKSEFIITFILSMAINYHPYEVQFVLIDYKGGGLAGAFENKETGIRLPHLAGTITNLDVSEMNRTLVSINSELKRRQRIFNEARDQLNESTIDIYKYQKFYREGKVKEPISHLFIISDEFAELKSQQPDFMDSLVSTARIGRSLGVHLILSTQKPSGVVDDQIWSNSRFKVCLKVATAEDSRELLRRNEAAEIKETGRFYLQVGFDELFELGQSAWAGAKYNPTDHILKNIDDSIEIIDDVGNVIRTINDERQENQENHGEQLTNIIKALDDIAQRENIKPMSMWLPSLPDEIFISDLIKKYNYKAEPCYMKPIIGEYDDPERQFQGEFDIDFTSDGNLLIYGIAGSGKENLITTILYSLCICHTVEELNIYILDFGAETLKIFNNMPQVGDVALVDDKNKINSLFLMLEREMTRRKELFSEYGGSYIDYVASTGKKIPTIFVVINGWESFAEAYGGYIDIVGHLARECSKYGIIFITSAVATNTMSTMIQQCYTNKIALQLSDAFDYKFTMNARDGLIPKKAFSRGLGIVNEVTYEFQTAYIYHKDRINDLIKQVSDKLSAIQDKAPPIPIIPELVSADLLTPHISDLNSVPIGVNIRDASVFKFNFVENKITPIVGNYVVTEKNFIEELLKILNLLQNTKLKIIDFADAVVDPSEFEDYANGEFTNSINNILVNEKTETKKMIYVIIGIGRIYDKVLDEGIARLFDIFSKVSSFKNSSFIIIDNYSIYRKITKEPWYKVINPNKGIWVGPDIEMQNVISCNNISKADLNEDFYSITYVADGEEYAVLKGISSKSEEEF